MKKYQLLSLGIMGAVLAPVLFGPREKALNEESRSGLPGDFVSLSDGLSYYELKGNKKAPLLVMVNGFSVPSYLFEKIYYPLVEAGLRVLRFDLFGRGYSARPPKTNSMDFFVKQLKELLDALHLEESFLLMGHSMGGAIVTNFTDRYPERVKKLILIDPLSFPIERALMTRLVQLPVIGDYLLKVMGDNAYIKRNGRNFYEPDKYPELMEKFAHHLALKGTKRCLLSTMRHTLFKNYGAVYYRVGDHLEIPKLLIWGRDDLIVPFRISKQVVSAMPGIKFHPIEQCGHSPVYEKPSEVLAYLLNFINESGVTDSEDS